MARFLLIRHGENDFVKQGKMAGRMPDVHLNNTGYKQALLVAEKLTGAPVKALYSSPLERAFETAEPLSKALSLEICLRPALTEIDVGEWQGQSIKRLKRLKTWHTVMQSPSRMQFPGGETFAQAQIRICNELLELSRQYQFNDLVVCVSHADPIRLAVAYFLGLPLDLFQRLSVAPASITALEVDETDSRLLALNYEITFTLSKD